MPENQVRDIFIARVQQLMAQYQGSKTISHYPTVGAMREAYLKSFLRELLPPKFHPVTGFICDMYGKMTPQLDMIFVDYSELPTISLVNDTVIVPYEMALLTAEVKSKITKDTLEQIKRQREAIKEMRSQFLMGAKTPQSRTRGQTIGVFVMAFESDVGKDTLREWVEKEMGSPAGICVLNSGNRILSIYEQSVTSSRRHIELQEATSRDDYDPLLSFVGAVYRWLHILLATNSTMSDQERNRFWETHAMWLWEGYLSRYIYQQVQQLQVKP